MDIAEQTGAVFELVACPFVLCSNVWRHALTAQTSLYSAGVVSERERRGPPIGAGRVGMHGCGLYVRCEEIVVPSCEQETKRSELGRTRFLSTVALGADG